MPELVFRKASLEDYLNNLPSHWPGRQHFVSQHEVRADQLEALKSLLGARCSETDIEEFLANNAEVLALVMFLFSTGHHASWIFPKRQMSLPAGLQGGLIPDYITAGANSDGLSWFVLELKGPNHRAFVKRGKRVQLSSEASKGVCQLVQYIDTSSKFQAHLRDELKLTDFREPRGVLLIGLDEETEDEQVREFKGAWNRINPKIQIRSYSALLHQVAEKLRK